MFLFLSAPHSLNRPGAYSASLPLYAPLPQSTRGLISFFGSLRPALSISPGLIQLLWFSAPRPPDLPRAYSASLPLYAPLPQSTQGLFGFFASLRPALSISPGLIWLLCLSAPRSPDRLGAYLVSFPLCAPLSRSPRGLFCFFASLRPALSISPGLIQLLYLSTPRSLNRLGAYLASFPLCAPPSRSSRGLFSFYSSLRPALPIFPGLNLLLFLSAPRPPDLPGAYLASFPLCAPLPRSSRGLISFFSFLRPVLSIVSGLDSPPAAICAPCTQKSASDDNIVMRQTAFCTYSLHCFFT